MARYIGPVCRLCRREGMKLFLKGERCHTEKCAIEKRNFAPGQHGKDRKPKIVGYGLQLREKQKARRYYGLLEGQFRNLFEKAFAHQGHHRRKHAQHRWSGGWTTSFTAWASAPPAAQARQLVRHGHFMVNGRKVNIPSFEVEAQRRDRNSREEQEQSDHSACARRHRACALPNWLEVDRENLKGRVLAQPKREDLVQIQLNEQLIVELYSK